MENLENRLLAMTQEQRVAVWEEIAHNIAFNEKEQKLFLLALLGWIKGHERATENKIDENNQAA